MTRHHAAPKVRPDLYETITSKIIADLERGVRPWTRPWSAGHLAGQITRPLRHNLQPYSGVNVVLLWMEAVQRGYGAPIWMTFRQALELGGHVRKGEHGATVVYANRITRLEQDDDGRDVEREIPFLKAYTVFNVDQIDGLPSIFHATAEPCSIRRPASHTPMPSSRRPAPTSATAATRRSTPPRPTTCRCHSSRRSRTPRPTTPPSRMS